MRLLAALAAIPIICSAQVLLTPQNITFNSTFTLSPSQVAAAGLSAAAASNFGLAVSFERSNWAPSGSVLSDPFYTDLPANASSAPPGSLLKLEPFTDTSGYTIAPTLALSRFVYQSRRLDGSSVPVSAYILWPYHARRSALLSNLGGKVPFVSWGHGSSGNLAECAPSHIRNLWYQFSAPYELALAGYAVVATDYAGLGVPYYPGNGSAGIHGPSITHQFTAAPAAGNDILYAAQAAQTAFPDVLTPQFAVVGHSQGGGAAWAAAQQQLSAQIPGYLGAIAASPATNTLAVAASNPSQALGLILAARAILSALPQSNLSLSDVLTPAGVAALTLLEEAQGCSSAFTTLLSGILTADPTRQLIKPEFLNSTYAEQFQNMTVAGGKDFAGPMLVLQGDADPAIPEAVTTQYVNLTCQSYAYRGLQYVKAKGVGHVPAMYATRQIWLDWLDARFAGVGSLPACTSEEIGGDAPRPLGQYQGDLNYFLEYSLSPYGAA
ncbi:secretory lipase [Purpureocillium lavendulum]|uniref:Secretory lipase n=1 Tax=Purpureocillium lavendulum TaxID=1247861 RepID=A0AB34G0L2_9HYPO|nr:secretory lipase [Purpureocillium lavendulum]